MGDKAIRRMIEAAQNWEQLQEQFKDYSGEQTIKECIASYDRHLKGYIYDSLVFRYMKARDAEAELQMIKENISREMAMSYASRDKTKFIKILNEAMGEHD